jgi:DNA-binding transcriptional LysR family regulator
MIGAPIEHPLARRKSVRFAEAAKYAFVGPHADSSLSALLADAVRESGTAVQQRVQASSFEAMCRLVQTRLGVTLLPEGVLAPHAAAGRLVAIPLKEDWAERRMHLIVRDVEQLSPIARTLLDHLRTAGGVGQG